MSRTMTMTKTRAPPRAPQRAPPARVAPRRLPSPDPESESDSEEGESESDDGSYSPKNARGNGGQRLGNSSSSRNNGNGSNSDRNNRNHNPNPNTANNRANRPIAPLPRNGARRAFNSSSNSSPLFTPPSNETIDILSDDDDEDEITFLGMGPPTRVVEVKREDTIDLEGLEMGDMEEDDLEEEDLEEEGLEAAPRQDKGKGKARASPSPSRSPEPRTALPGRLRSLGDLFDDLAPVDLDPFDPLDLDLGLLADVGAYEFPQFPHIPPESPDMSRIGSSSRRVRVPLPSLYEESVIDPTDKDWVEPKPRIKIEPEEGNGNGPVLQLNGRNKGPRTAAGAPGGGPPGGSPPGAGVNDDDDSSDSSDDSDNPNDSDDSDDESEDGDGPRRIHAPPPDHDPHDDDDDDDDSSDDDSDDNSNNSSLDDQPDADGLFRRVGKAAVRLGKPKAHHFKPREAVPGSGGQGGGSQSLHRKSRAKLLHGLMGNTRDVANPLDHITLLYPRLNSPARIAEAVGADAGDQLEVDEVMRTAANFQLYASKRFKDEKSIRRLSNLETEIQANIFALLVGAVPPHDRSHLKHFKMLWPTADSWWAVATWVGAQPEDKDRVLAAATYFRKEECIDKVRRGVWLG